ncbi:hypothetical protein Trydic_g10615 [Trypoxylus dichotomus]
MGEGSARLAVICRRHVSSEYLSHCSDLSTTGTRNSLPATPPPPPEIHPRRYTIHALARNYATSPRGRLGGYGGAKRRCDKTQSYDAE